MIFKNKNREKARNLVSTVNVLAISSLTSFLTNFSSIEQIMKKCTTEDWDFFMTVAGIGIALQTNKYKPSDKEVDQFAVGLKEYLPKWNSQGAAAFDDLLKFTQRNITNGVDSIVAAGLWVLWNLKQEQPTDDEMSLAPIIGHYWVNNLSDWWNQN